MVRRLLWTAAIAALYAFFWNWYGGAGKPVSQAELADFFERVDANQSANLLENEADALAFRDRIRAMVADDDGREFYMVNLDQLAEGPDAEAADRRYAETVLPLLVRRGSFPVLVTTTSSNMLGDFGEEVDRVAIVRYRSLRDFLDMISHPDLVAGVPDKEASLAHNDVFVTRPLVSLAGVRSTVALMLVFVWLIGTWIINRFFSRPAR